MDKDESLCARLREGDDLRSRIEAAEVIEDMTAALRSVVFELGQLVQSDIKTMRAYADAKSALNRMEI